MGRVVQKWLSRFFGTFDEPMLTLFLDESCLELTRIERSCNEGLLFASKHYTAGLRLKALLRLKNVMPKNVKHYSNSFQFV